MSKKLNYPGSPRSPSQSSLGSSGTVIFNVGGKRFELSSDMINKYPDSLLVQIVRQRTAPSNSPAGMKEVFLDHNYEAFSVIVDYLRYGGQLLVPKTVCKEVVILQLKEFGIPVDKIVEDEKSSGLPTYDDVVGRGEKSNDFARKVQLKMEQKMNGLVENYIHPLILKHVEMGNGRLDIYMLDPKIAPNEVATTIDYDVAVEWICLQKDKTLFQDQPISSDDENIESLKSLISSMGEISKLQRERLLSALEHDHQLQQATELPDVAYILQPNVFTFLEALVTRRSTVRKVHIERKDLTVRRENSFGLLESSSIPAVKISVTIA